MAEVGQRLASGVYRLSSLRRSQSRPVYSGESPGFLQVNCTFSDSRIKEESELDDGEVLAVSKGRATQRKTYQLSRVTGGQQVKGTFLCTTCLDLDSSRFIGFAQTTESMQSYHAALSLSAVKVVPVRMASWTRGAVSFCPDTFRSPQHLRTLCTVLFILAEHGSEQPVSGLRRLTQHPDPLRSSKTSRSYSRRTDGSVNDAPLYRSRTAYYNILNVSPNATQSQIKTAYYKQSFIYHPDKNMGDKEATQRFAEISEAYTVLGNISLRRKYDRGIFSQSDLQSAGTPSSKEASSRSTGSPKNHQQRARQFSQTQGKTMFDFDAFYQAHYGEQLQRERDMRARMQHMQEMKKKKLKKWKESRIMEFTVAMLLTTAGLIFVNLSKP